MAVVIGWDQTLFLAASTPVNYPEYEMAGSLRGAPVELVQCELSDLLVPASAEIVLEGFVSSDPATFTLEGPFSEYPGYYGGSQSPKHTIRVECITHRNDPIFHGCLTGASPGRTNEGTTWTPATFSAMAWHYLEQAGVPNITGVWRGKWPETMRVQIRKSHRGHAQQVATALWGCHLGNYAAKHVIVVDDDIDIHDWEAIEWALCYRVNAGLGDISFFAGTSGSMLDPSVPLEDRNSVKYGHGSWTRVLIDATINWQLQPQEQYGGNRYPAVGTSISNEMAEQAKKEMARLWILRSSKSVRHVRGQRPITSAGWKKKACRFSWLRRRRRRKPCPQALETVGWRRRLSSIARARRNHRSLCRPARSRRWHRARAASLREDYLCLSRRRSRRNSTARPRAAVICSGAPAACSRRR